MRIVTGGAVAFNCGRVTDPVGPVSVNIVTAKAESGLRLEQVSFFIVAVGVMTDGTVPVPIRGALRRLAILVAGCTEILCFISQHERS